MSETEHIERVDVMPWECSKEDHQARLKIIHALNERPKHQVSESSFIARGAHVFTDSLALGEKSLVAMGVVVRGDVSIGSHCSINAYAQISGRVKIGNAVRIASNVVIAGFKHGFERIDQEIFKQPCTYKGIVIEDDVWIGANAVLTDGITVGAHSVIAAGAVVTKNVAPYSIMGGNPAKLIRDRRSTKIGSSAVSIERKLKNLSGSVAQQWPEMAKRFFNRQEVRTALKSIDDNVSDKPAYPPRHIFDAIEITSGLNQSLSRALRKDAFEYLTAILNKSTILLDGSTREVLKRLGNYNYVAIEGVLRCLDENPPHAFSGIDAIQPSDVIDHLNCLNWVSDGWNCGDWVDCFSSLLVLANISKQDIGDPSAALLGSTRNWLIDTINPSTGMWSPPNNKNGWLFAVNGFYRAIRMNESILEHIDVHQSIIDTMLAHWRCICLSEGKNFNACNVLDIVYPLRLCATKQSNYRTDEIRSLMSKVILMTENQWVDGQGFGFSFSETPSLKGTEMWLSILATAADYLDCSQYFSFKPKGVHRLSASKQD